MKSRNEELNELFERTKSEDFIGNDGYEIAQDFIAVMERHQNETKLGQAACSGAENYLDYINDFDYENAEKTLRSEFSQEDLFGMKTLFEKTIANSTRFWQKK